jgi:hypothetical protein
MSITADSFGARVASDHPDNFIDRPDWYCDRYGPYREVPLWSDDILMTQDKSTSDSTPPSFLSTREIGRELSAISDDKFDQISHRQFYPLPVCVVEAVKQGNSEVIQNYNLFLLGQYEQALLFFEANIAAENETLDDRILFVPPAFPMLVDVRKNEQPVKERTICHHPHNLDIKPKVEPNTDNPEDQTESFLDTEPLFRYRPYPPSFFKGMICGVPFLPAAWAPKVAKPKPTLPYSNSQLQLLWKFMKQRVVVKSEPLN